MKKPIHSSLELRGTPARGLSAPVRGARESPGPRRVPQGIGTAGISLIPKEGELDLLGIGHSLVI